MKWGYNMKKYIRILAIVLIILSTVFVFGCNGCSSCKDGDDPYVLQLNKTELQTLIGDINTLSVKNKDAVPENITWTSENTSVATVTNEGVVESMRIGSTKIKATYGDYVAECTVTVTLGNNLPQLVIENERPEYRIGKNTENFPFELYVLYNGKKFYDAEINCASTNNNVVSFNADNGTTLQIGDKGKVSVTFSANWRGIEFNNMPSLIKIIDVSVVDEVFFYVNGLQYEEIELYTLSQFDGANYLNEMEFVLSANIAGVDTSNVVFDLPENGIIVADGSKIKATSFGDGYILLKHTDASGYEYQSSIKVTVIRPEATYKTDIDYFSTFTGTFKDSENNYANTTIINKLFGTDSVDNLKVYQDGVELTVNGGKILGVANNYNNAYDTVLKVETDKAIYNVNVKVYGLVVQSKEDLELFALKILKNDDPNTHGIDETKVTAIDGYCVLINDVDASGVTIPHEIFDYTYDYVNANGETEKVGITMKRYNLSVKPALRELTDAEIKEVEKYGTIDAFGFLGTFDGQGYTISNLDTSVETGKTGGGLFGYAFGSAVIGNVGFDNLKISNSSGIAYASFIPVPRPSPVDMKGLRTGNNTYFHDIYINLSEDTVNPKGSVVNMTFDAGFGLVNMQNIIIDATNVALNESTSGGVFVNEPVLLCAENNPLRFYSNDVYVITDEFPSSFTSAKTVYGKNEANGAGLDKSSDATIYSSKFSRYDSFNDMVSANNDYSSFASSSWLVNGYPIFKTASGVYAYYLGETVLDNTIKVNSSTNGREISLTTLSGQAVQIVSFEYDSNQLNVDSENKVKLAVEVTEKTFYELKVNYTYKNKSGALNLKVIAYPSEIDVEEAVVMSSIDGVINLANYVESPKAIVSVSQKIGDNTTALSVGAGGVIVGAIVDIKSDYSDVETSTLIIETVDMKYNFTNVKVYSHILTEAEDLSVFKHTKSTGRITGYYILGANINAKNYSIGNDDTLFALPSFADNTHAFQGVLDGRGYAIYNFRPTVSGLLGSVYSDSEANGGRSVIRDIAFVNVLSESGKDFTILGTYLESAGNNLTEVTNIHVSILNTYYDNYHYTSNYKGLFHTNDFDGINTFKFTNIYVETVNENGYIDLVGYGSGSLFTRDQSGVHANLQARSARFDNVITVTQMKPCVYRQTKDGSLVNEFHKTYMYFIYAENDAGSKGLGISINSETVYPHNPISENGENGSYLYNNVYRYDSLSEVNNEYIQKLIATGSWKLVENKLTWASLDSDMFTDEDINFDKEWLK